MTLPKTFAAAASLLVACTGAFSASLEALQGAWTMNGTDCSATFKNTGGEVDFIDRTSGLTTGIIVRGGTITGPNSVCTAKKIVVGKDHLSVHLSCADAIMFSDMSVSFRILDVDNFQRFDPQFPEVSVIYHRCSR